MEESVTMKNKAQLYARRREMYRLHVQKLNMTEILDKLSAKYSISKQALWDDWQKRTQWVYDVFDLEPARVSWPAESVRAWKRRLNFCITRTCFAALSRDWYPRIRRPNAATFCCGSSTRDIVKKLSGSMGYVGREKLLSAARLKSRYLCSRNARADFNLLNRWQLVFPPPHRP